MKDKLLTISFIVIVIISTLTACQKSVADSVHVLPSPIVVNQNNQVPSTQHLEPSIRKVDFKNFTYPLTSGLSTKNETTFTVKNGESFVKNDKQLNISLWKVEYANLNDDYKEDAILTFFIHTGGSAMPNIVYLYTQKSEKPELLWSFDTGDRAAGGLKKVYEKNGEFIIELFGNNKFDEIKKEFLFPGEVDLNTGLCCPSNFTQFRFKWNGKEFIVNGSPKLLAID